ncbi:MAG: MBL fold metallo-hydrolase [Firmicutes bacterium]|nr:MBL fold metallo-hydrolase [Bacillota bacterium]
MNVIHLIRSPDVYLVASGVAGMGLSNPYDANTYLICDGKEACLIDAAATPDIGEHVYTLCSHMGITLKWVFLTHGHADHAGGVIGIRHFFPSVQVFAGPTLMQRWVETEDPISLERAKRAGVYPPDFFVEQPAVDRELHDGEQFLMSRCRIVAWHTPGHAPEHMVYSVITEDGHTLLFAGDHIFPGGFVAIEPIPECSVVDYANSMKRLESIPHEALFAGHLCPTLMDGGRSVKKALQYFDALWVPPSLNMAMV